MPGYLEFDDGESPEIGPVPAGVPWEQAQNHIKIAHDPLLVPPGGSAQYLGANWAGTKLVVPRISDQNLEQAIREFGEFLRERGEAPRHRASPASEGGRQTGSGPIDRLKPGQLPPGPRSGSCPPKALSVTDAR